MERVLEELLPAPGGGSSMKLNLTGAYSKRLVGRDQGPVIGPKKKS